jgi:hypothetical protein
MVQCFLQKIRASGELGEFYKDYVQLAEDGKVVWEAFENGEESISSLAYMSVQEYKLCKKGRTVRKSPISLARDARSHNASTLVGSKL